MKGGILMEDDNLMMPNIQNEEEERREVPKRAQFFGAGAVRRAQGREEEDCRGAADAGLHHLHEPYTC